jgi:hypothetical protein
LRVAEGRGNVLRTMPTSNKPADPESTALVALLGPLADVARGLWRGALGRTVRCVPTRRVVMARDGEGWVFGKWRTRGRSAAAAEWRALHELPALGLRVSEPLAWLGRGARTLLLTRGVAGRALDAWAADADREGWRPALVRWACERVAPCVRRLHDHGLVYRDLYWNHVFATDPRAGDAAGEPVFVDAERVFRPRWGMRRWRIKDLAGLLASAPADLPPRAALRFARAYFGAGWRGEREMLAAIAAKAARIRGRAPRYG